MVQSSASSSAYIVVLVTAANQSEATQIATALLEAKLAACISIFPVTSHYTWQGQLHCESEYQLVIKTQVHCFGALEAKVRSQHSYEVPEIIGLPLVTGSTPYLDWIFAQLNPDF
ncbi:divalent cation tolerance protein CutA [Synechococcales cyanobacterium C]|uniref:Divalent cation tolerance protein CutA n=1 Tax=Petrachloros mirabilis ULC683 TaxID=2781853 RepID=A0A8K2ABU7_9CYAN|nr:divalent-cation tolerance protein CutA [Petrachloros mirabilis]NCJ05115.1 divalent cation tolerance protein CutA [Petrachloros mirabilis ULC683]